jgi:hypothetical protein
MTETAAPSSTPTLGFFRTLLAKKNLFSRMTPTQTFVVVMTMVMGVLLLTLLPLYLWLKPAKEEGALKAWSGLSSLEMEKVILATRRGCLFRDISAGLGGEDVIPAYAGMEKDLLTAIPLLGQSESLTQTEKAMIRINSFTENSVDKVGELESPGALVAIAQGNRAKRFLQQRFLLPDKAFEIVPVNTASLSTAPDIVGNYRCVVLIDSPY